MKNQNKFAVIYARTATLEPLSQTNLSNQISSCLEYAKEKEYLVTNIFTDIGASGKSIAGRAELNRLIDYVIQNNVSIVLTSDMTRVSRNHHDLMGLISYLQKIGKEIVTLSPSELTSCSSGRLIKNMLMVFSQFDNDIKNERTQQGMRNAFLSGRWLWKAPIGYRVVNGKLKISNTESEIIKELYQSLAQYQPLVSAMEIAECVLNSYPVSRKDIYRLVANPIYKGWMKSSLCEELVKGIHTPIVDEKTWKKANNFLTKQLPK